MVSPVAEMRRSRKPQETGAGQRRRHRPLAPRRDLPLELRRPGPARYRRRAPFTAAGPGASWAGEPPRPSGVRRPCQDQTGTLSRRY